LGFQTVDAAAFITKTAREAAFTSGRMNATAVDRFAGTDFHRAIIKHRCVLSRRWCCAAKAAAWDPAS